MGDRPKSIAKLRRVASPSLGIIGGTSYCYLGVVGVVSVNYFMDPSLALGCVAGIFQEYMGPFESASDLGVLTVEGAENYGVGVDRGVLVEPACVPETHLAFLDGGLALGGLAAELVFVVNDGLSEVLAVLEGEGVHVGVGLAIPFVADAWIALPHSK